MNLVLDFGNTRIKAALFENNRIIQKNSFENANEILDSDILKNEIQNCLISSVTKNHLTVFKELKNKFPSVVLNHKLKIPIRNVYANPASLGSDRLAAAIGSHIYFSNQNTLTLDIGTCIKYNFVNWKNRFIGGAISPGINMRLHSMNRGTHLLPDLESPSTDKQKLNLIGKNTEESLFSGAVIGTACEVDEMTNRYKKKYSDLNLVITGGDFSHLRSHLKNHFLARPDLILQGLNKILNLNTGK